MRHDGVYDFLDLEWFPQRYTRFNLVTMYVSMLVVCSTFYLQLLGVQLVRSSTMENVARIPHLFHVNRSAKLILQTFMEWVVNLFTIGLSLLALTSPTSLYNYIWSFIRIGSLASLLLFILLTGAESFVLIHLDKCTQHL